MPNSCKTGGVALHGLYRCQHGDFSQMDNLCHAGPVQLVAFLQADGMSNGRRIPESNCPDGQ